MDDEPEPLEYLVAHLQDALAQDPRVSELGLHIAVRGMKVYVTGSVQTEERRMAIDAVAAAIVGEYEVHNQTVVTAFAESEGVEKLS